MFRLHRRKEGPEVAYQCTTCMPPSTSACQCAGTPILCPLFTPWVRHGDCLAGAIRQHLPCLVVPCRHLFQVLEQHCRILTHLTAIAVSASKTRWCSQCIESYAALLTPHRFLLKDAPDLHVSQAGVAISIHYYVAAKGLATLTTGDVAICCCDFDVGGHQSHLHTWKRERPFLSKLQSHV